MKQWITGSFDNRADAEAAVDRLTELGYARDEVSVMMSDDTRTRQFGDGADAGVAGTNDRGSNIAKGAAGGGMIGGTLGAIAAAVVGTGAVGLTVATGGVAAPFIAGPIAAMLAAGGAGAAAGSILGGLVGAGMPEADARRAETDVSGGHIVVCVHADDTDTTNVRRVMGTAAY